LTSSVDSFCVDWMKRYEYLRLYYVSQKKITYMLLLPCYRPAKLIEFEMKLKLMDGSHPSVAHRVHLPSISGPSYSYYHLILPAVNLPPFRDI
jgi:hypothetical protein